VERNAAPSLLRLLFDVGVLVALVMIVLGIFRVGFAVRFWKRMQVIAFTYIAIIVLLALVRGFGLV
jgi:hypothetical protein